MSDNTTIRPWVSVGEAATQAIGKISYELPKSERDQAFIDRMDKLASHDTDSGQTMVDTDDLRRLVEIAERFRELDRAAAKHVETVIIAYSRHFTGFDEYVGWQGLGIALRKDYELLDAYERAEEEEINAILDGKK
jgi:hypothetical protein